MITASTVSVCKRTTVEISHRADLARKSRSIGEKYQNHESWTTLCHQILLRWKHARGPNRGTSQTTLRRGCTVSNISALWVNGVERARTDLNTIASFWRVSDEGLVTVIAGKLDVDLQLSTGKFARSLGIVASTVYRYFTEVLRLKGR
jgi:hypothetical protein